MERLPRHPLLKAAARRPAITRHLYNVYYDTPEFALRSDKVALRLRRDGTKWTQTLKTAGRVEGRPSLRQEHDTPVPAQLLNYHALAQSGASAVFNDAELRASLQAVFVTDFKRSTHDIEAASGTLVELCIDSGSVTAGTNTAPISEANSNSRQVSQAICWISPASCCSRCRCGWSPGARPNAAMPSRRRLSRPVEIEASATGCRHERD